MLSKPSLLTSIFSLKIEENQPFIVAIYVVSGKSKELLQISHVKIN